MPLNFFTLQHFIGQREEFETARDSILVWLTEMDLQLTNIEHFSECDVQAKIKQLKVKNDYAVTEGGMKEGIKKKKKSHAWWEKNFKKHYAEMQPDVVPLLAG